MTEHREDLVDVPFEAPQGEVEEAVAEIMKDVLDVDLIGRDDSFYDFSGTSLQAIRICARIEHRLGLKAVPLWLFSHDVLQDFCRELSAQAEGAHV